VIDNKIDKTIFPEWMSVGYVTGQFDPSTHSDFTVIPTEYADRAGLYLRKDVFEAYKRMYEHASQDGVSLTIRSATRNFNYQKGIWERKWTGETILSDDTKASDISDHVARAKKILLYSSMPGTSRHHWGTDVDLNSFDNEYFKHGVGKLVYDWLKEHGPTYGFCQPYTDKSEGRTGYEEERWHWTYVPVSKLLTEYSNENLTNELIDGFLGSETAPHIDVKNNYILGIAKECT